MSAQIQNKEEFFTRLFEAFNDGKFDGVNPGKYEGEDFLIVDSWETLVSLGAWINGYEGDLNIAVVWGNSDGSKEESEARHELGQLLIAYPDRVGRMHQLQNRLKQLANLESYKEWLEKNQIEPIGLNDLEIEVGFSDEYDLCCCSCNGCENIVRTSPDSYSWTPPLFVDCEGYACDECATDFSDYVLEEFCNVEKSIPDQFDTDELGLVKINDDSYENGFHRGMDDSPKPIIEKLNAADIDVWFKVYPSQFYCEFDVYVRSENEEKAKGILANTDTYQGYSTAGNLENALKEITKQQAELKGEGIKYSKVNVEDGTAETRLVSKEEFIKGIK